MQQGTHQIRHPAMRAAGNSSQPPGAWAISCAPWRWLGFCGYHRPNSACWVFADWALRQAGGVGRAGANPGPKFVLSWRPLGQAHHPAAGLGGARAPRAAPEHLQPGASLAGCL